MLTLDEQIVLKADPNSKFTATIDSIIPSQTDHDHFPYTRYYRGDYKKQDYKVTENNAGWQRLNNECYKSKSYAPITPNDMCFQLPCNTVLPCNVVNSQDKKSKKNCGCGLSPSNDCIVHRP